MFLEKNFYVDIEGLSNWNDYRAKPYEVEYSTTLMCHRALPLRVEFWGALGDFSREIIVHPGFEKSILSKLSNKILGCENPLISIPLIDSITGTRQIDKRGFTCKVLFDLGVSLGTLLGLYYTAIQYENGDLKNIPASITWCILDVQPILLELGLQYSQSEKLNVPPPPVKFNPMNNFREALSSVESLVNWIDTEFIGKDRDIHNECFHSGLTIYPFLDEYCYCNLSEDQKESIEQELVFSSTRFLKRISNQYSSYYISKEFTTTTIDLILDKYFNHEISSLTAKSIEDISPKKHLELYHDLLMDLLDRFVTPINYCISPSHNLSDYQYLDWIWIKKQILYFKENGMQFPAIKVNFMEEVDVFDISQEIYASALKIDFNDQFVFITSNGKWEMALVRRWEEVIS